MLFCIPAVRSTHKHIKRKGATLESRLRITALQRSTAPNLGFPNPHGHQPDLTYLINSQAWVGQTHTHTHTLTFWGPRCSETPQWDLVQRYSIKLCQDLNCTDIRTAVQYSRWKDCQWFGIGSPLRGLPSIHLHFATNHPCETCHGSSWFKGGGGLGNVVGSQAVWTQADHSVNCADVNLFAAHWWS